MNSELPDVQSGFRKGRGTRDQISDMCWITEKAREFHKNIYFCIIAYAKVIDCVDHSKLWKILKEMGVPDHLIVSWETCMQVKKQQIEQTAAAAAAKLLQLCPTLCDPIDSSPPGFPVPGILQARTMEWVAISFSS